jgi:hypothetical protein
MLAASLALSALLAAMSTTSDYAFAAEAKCMPSPELAVAAYARPVLSDARAQQDAELAFRIHHVRRDAFTGRRWAWIEMCGAPDKPWTVVRVPSTKDDLLQAGPQAQASKAASSVRSPDRVEIRAGEIVDIAREQDTMVIHVRGKALASGRRGEKINVLVTALSGTTAVEGLVAGPGTVTLMF